MTRAGIVATAVVGGCLVLAAAGARGATPVQLGAKCADAWKGTKGTPAYRAYRTRCIAAAGNAVSAATDAGNPTNAVANAARARTACGVQFRAPRTTAAKRAAFTACVAATTTSQRLYAPRPLRATLLGSNEVPPAGAATGSALIRLNEGRRRICFTITASGLGGSPVTAAHIHTGGSGASGPPIVGFTNLTPLDSGKPSTGCIPGVASAVLRGIRQAPGRYYVNVHTVAFPGGAARGQLAR